MAPSTLENVRILVVDDDDDARELLRAALSHMQATVLDAPSAADAYPLLENGEADVLLSDIAMPGEDGYSLIRRVRALGGVAGRIPAIAVTAFSGAKERARALEAGFDRHVGKPVDLEALAVAILALLT